MRVSIAILPVLFTSSVLAANVLLEARATCNADNCYRAVAGTKASPASTIRSSDCASFLRTTVSSFAADSTQTIRPTAVPTYASACRVGNAVTSDLARYSSACSCFGVAASTATVLPQSACDDSTEIQAACSRECGYTQKCNYGVESNGKFQQALIEQRTASSVEDCAAACSEAHLFPICGVAAFEPASGVCTLWTAEGSQLVPDPGVIALTAEDTNCSC